MAAHLGTTTDVDDAPAGPGAGLATPPGRERIGWSWLVALMVANTVAAAGLLGDIARHLGQTELLTGADFLSGWHLVLYGGVSGVAVVLGAFALRYGPRAPLRLLPSATYGLATLCVGGGADAVWHELFGVEAALEALVSPPHLVILLGLVLLMVAPIGAVAAGPDQPLDGVQSVVLALSISSLLIVISLFTGYLTPLIGGSEFQSGAYVEPLVGTSTVDYDVTRGLGVSLWFSALAAVIVVVIRSCAAPAVGTWTIAFGFLGLAPLITTGEVAVPLAIALLVYGLASDATATRARPHPLLTGLAVAALWGAFFLAVSRRGELAWVGELWAGVIATGFLVGAAVGQVVRWMGRTAPARSLP